MPVFYGPLAPLPEGGRRGRNARDRYFGGEGPTLEKMRELMASLEWYDATLIPEATVQRRYEQSLDPGEMHLAASSDSLRGEWQDLEGHLRAIRCRTLFAWGMHDAFLTPDYPMMLARMVPHGQLFVMDRGVAPPAGGAAVGLRGDGRGLPRPVGAAHVNVPRTTVAVLAVVGLAALQRARLVALLTSTTGTWVGSPVGVRADRRVGPP